MNDFQYTEYTNVTFPQYSFDWSNQNVQRKLSNKPKKQESNNVPNWLAARYYLRSLNEDVIISCYDKIINSFDTKKQIIETLVKASTTIQIKRIVEILKDAQSIEMEKNNNQIIAKYNQTKIKSYFQYLSTESIFNICEFLDKTSMKYFKLTSTANALVAFEIMKSYKIGVFNMNELITQSDYKYPLDLNINEKIKTNRVKPFSKYGSLINSYSKRYNIPIQNILILQSYNSDWNMCNSLSQATILNNIQNPDLIQERVEKNKAFSIFDQRKILKINNSNKLQIMQLNPKSDEIKTHTIVLLQYFDRFEQRIQNLQFLWLNPITSIQRLQKYIINELLSVYTKLYGFWSCQWCNKLLYTINKMKQFAANLNEPLLKIYFSTKKPMVKDLCYNEYKPFKINNDKINVDQQFDINNCDVFEENGIVYNAMIRTTTTNAKFFKLQVLKMKDRDTYYSFFRWGRSGNQGQTKIIENDKLDCIDAFEKKFRQKTGNNWADRTHFVHQVGKYGYSMVDSVSKCGDFKIITFELNNKHSFFISQTNQKYGKRLTQPFYENVKEYTFDKQLDFELKISHSEALIQILCKESDVNWWEHCPNTILTLKVTPQTIIYMIQNQLSKYCNNVIPANNIAIFEEMKKDNNIRRKYLDWKDTVSNMAWKDKQCYFQIVPYNTWVDKHYTMCRVCIYEPPFYTPDNVAHFTFPVTPLFVVYLRMVDDQDENKHECKDNDDDDDVVILGKQFLFKVDKLVKNMIDMMSPQVYGKKYEQVTGKFGQTDAFSFMVMNQNDIKNKKFKCYEMGSTYVANMNELGICNVDVYILQNSKQLYNSCKIENNSKGFAIIARMCQLSEFVFDSVSSNKEVTGNNYCSNIGYPKKVWITTETTLQQIIDTCLEFDKDRYDFSSCLSQYGNIKIDDNIYEKMKVNNDQQIHPEVLIQLKPKTTDVTRNFFVDSNKQ